jgi:CRP/FNR family cyclic AMP-dependent transcriptional regulator
MYVYLLDVDDDLAQDLAVRMRPTARQHVTAQVLEAEAGECDLSDWFRRVGPGPGLLLIDGLIVVETRVADRTSTELLGSTDLLQPPGPHADDMIGGHAVWRALVPSRLALLDAEFLDRVKSWPQIPRALFLRTEHRATDLGILRTISSQPKLEVRLVLLFWHLATRWGRVEPAGLRLTLPLTHRMLGQFVAAERPSISHALGRLAHAEIVTGTPGDWHLHGSIDEHLATLIEGPAHLPTSHRGAEDRLTA